MSGYSLLCQSWVIFLRHGVVYFRYIMRSTYGKIMYVIGKKNIRIIVRSHTLPVVLRSKLQRHEGILWNKINQI